MPKYLAQCSYTVEGVKGLLKDGGSKRREAVEQLVKGMGGTLEGYYYAFGDNDLFVITDMPDNVSTAAFSLMINASGAINAKTIVLLTPEEIDEAAKKTVNYRPPGQ